MSHWYNVEALIGERKKLLDQIRHIEMMTDASHYVGVTLQGTYQDAAMVAAVKPVVLAQLQERLSVNGLELLGLGVKTVMEQTDV